MSDFKFEINPDQPLDPNYIPHLRREAAGWRTQYQECRIERTAQAEYCVRLEDRIVDYMVERKWLIDCLQHLHEHLIETAPTTPCDDIHKRIGEYVK